MSHEQRLKELVSHWEKLRDKGEAVTAEELCRGCPDLLGEVTEQLLTLAAQGQGATSSWSARLAISIPAKLGRYTLLEELGSGGFGTVYRGYDESLDRAVAVKVPHPRRFITEEDRASLMREARNVAQLDHPNILTVYDVGQQGDTCYIVYKLIEGVHLGDHRKQAPLSPMESALLVAQIAEALEYAHRQGLYHRDIKPSNILLDKEGKPFIADFGLAVREAELADEKSRRAGTAPYMSPEQVRGEGHRIDGRTDIYSLGVVLYELLAHKRPFEAGSKEQLFDQILEREPRPPRQVKESIPREMERICLKAISKRVTDRYTTAKDMAEELRLAVSALSTTPSGVAAAASSQSAQPLASVISKPDSCRESLSGLPVRIVPKGLRSFGPEDSDFFLQLLPGPRDREGLPDSIRFWKTHIESRDPETTFAVGLIYGPSGCGKSSMVKAGLLPRLDRSVLQVYVESTREDTEGRLAQGLRKSCPALQSDRSLADTISRLRRGQDLAGDQKILIVLDQFEQWLHAHGHEIETTGLFAALRHADGEHVQVIVIVRDDFWMGVSRLFDMLEIGLDRERNTRSVDLFDLQHARQVLLRFGQAFDRLPPNEDNLPKDRNSFLEQAVDELSQDGRVISVRLSLFAELIKDRPWTLASLVEVGGTAGVGVRFLEETFTSRTAVPEHRAVEKSARALLQALLPEGSTDIKGHMRSRQELATACGLPDHSHRFVRLIQILDHDLHIITPTEAESRNGRRETRDDAKAESRETRDASRKQSDSGHCALDSRFSTLDSLYQLTHDYLVPPLRNWLTLERRKTWRGRAELCLEQRTAHMSRWPQSRYLPSPFEFLAITFGVPPRKRKPEQRTLMREATRHYAVRCGSTIAAVLLLSVAVFSYLGRIDQERVENDVDTLLRQSPDRVEKSIVQLEQSRRRAIPLLRRRFVDAAPGSRERLHAALALAKLDRLDDAEQEFLLNSIHNLPPSECKNLVTALEPITVAVTEKLVTRSRDERLDSIARVRDSIVLLDLGRPQAARELLHLAANPVHRTNFIHGFPSWHGNLQALPEILRHTPDNDFHSGLCVVLGLLDPEPLADTERDGLLDILVELYRDAPGGGTHSASGWALREWKAKLNMIKLPIISESRSPEPGQHWFVTENQLTMIDVPPGAFVMQDPSEQTEGPTITFTGGFYMLDREIPARLFRELLDDPDYPDSEKPNDWRPDDRARLDGLSVDSPVQRVSWFDAVLFCNWLSHRERLEPCYSRTGDTETLNHPSLGPMECEVWCCDYGKSGYRLPQASESEYACRSGVATDFVHGNRKELLDAYAVYSAEHIAPGASRIPNGWGFFDMLGNVIEWCWNSAGEIYPSQITDPRAQEARGPRALRGGAFRNSVEHCRMGLPFQASPLDRSDTKGFRVVRAHPSLASP